MVASDTIVGLVGAGILIVALVGVFVYESRETGTSLEARVVDPVIGTDGKAFLNAQRGSIPVPGLPCQAPACTPANTEVYFNATGLPAPGELAYVAFLKKSDTEYLNVGKLACSADKCSLASRKPGQDNSNSREFVVGLEKTETVNKPSVVIYHKPVASGTTDLSQGMREVVGKGTHGVRLDDASGNVEATVTFDGLANYTGFQYRAWLQKDDMTWDHLANYTGSDLGTTTLAGSVSGGAPGAIDGYSKFLVSLEKPESRTDQPHGYPVFQADVTA